MNKIKRRLIIFLLSLSFFTSFANNNNNIFVNTGEIPYCKGNSCGYDEGLRKIGNELKNVEKQKTLSEYIQDVMVYLLSFITVIAVIYIVYAGFKLIFSSGTGDGDSMKKTRTTILYLAIGIILIWLSYPIVLLIVDILNKSSSN